MSRFRRPLRFRGGSRSTGGALLPWAIPIVLVAGAAALAPSAAWSAEPEIVARVDGEPVTRGELQRMLALAELHRELGSQKPDSTQLERVALRKLISRRLILQEAGRRGLTVTEQDVDQGIVELRRRFRDLKKFGAWLRARGLDERSLWQAIRDEILITRVNAALVEGVRPTEAQVQDYYVAHKGDLKTAEEVRLRVIAVKDKRAADETLAALRKGEDFARLARQRSVGSDAALGGDVGWVRPSRLPPALAGAVESLKAGEIGGPVQTGAKFLLVQLEERRPARAMSRAEARPEIERRLLPAKQLEVLRAWLAEQEKKSKIEVFR